VGLDCATAAERIAALGKPFPNDRALQDEIAKLKAQIAIVVPPPRPALHVVET
jgi:hypothetical protein